MTDKNSRRFTAAFKANVAVDALLEQHSTAELAQHHRAHQVLEAAFAAGQKQRPSGHAWRCCWPR